MTFDTKTTTLLGAVRDRKPLIHNITNYVVMNFSANALLSVGASPVMAHAISEVEEMTGLAGTLVLNIGTLSPPWIEAMLKAGSVAKRRGIPIVLDPVGAGATRLRTDTARQIVSDVVPTVIRGNASEVLALVSETAATKGVDSAHGVADAEAVAIRLAREHDMVVAITGPEDLVTDGKRLARVQNGHPLMGRVTGTGCVASAVVGAFCAVGSDPFESTVAGLATFGIAGELGARTEPRPGSYHSLLIDGLDEVGERHLTSMLRVTFEDAKP